MGLRLLLVLCAVAFAVAAHTALAGYDGVTPEPELSPLASTFDGKPVTVYCDRGLGFYGMAEPATDSLWLNGDFCGPLRLLHAGIDVYPARQGIGLISLAHESIHLRGVRNEAQTECYAYQLTDDLARIFGAREKYIPRLLHFAYADHNALIAHVATYRDARRCRPNGAYDLSPHDGVWP